MVLLPPVAEGDGLITYVFLSLSFFCEMCFFFMFGIMFRININLVIFINQIVVLVLNN